MASSSRICRAFFIKRLLSLKFLYSRILCNEVGKSASANAKLWPVNKMAQTFSMLGEYAANSPAWAHTIGTILQSFSGMYLFTDSCHWNSYVARHYCITLQKSLNFKRPAEEGVCDQPNSDQPASLQTEVSFIGNACSGRFSAVLPKGDSSVTSCTLNLVCNGVYPNRGNILLNNPFFLSFSF